MSSNYEKKFSTLKLQSQLSIDEQLNNKYISLIELLDEAQPYKELSRFRENQLSSSERTSPLLPKIQGSLIGLAVGDALGAAVEFRPNSYMVAHPVSEMISGGTWGLKAGQWTDDTSMALCLAASLINKGGFDAYDQLVRYKRWFRNGYLSSTGNCFDIGASTRQAIIEFENRQIKSAKVLKNQYNLNLSEASLDKEIGEKRDQLQFDTNCGASDAAGNGALMRLAPIPLFYHRSLSDAIQHAGNSAKTTHGDRKAIDTCAFYAELIWNAVNGASKTELLSTRLFRKYLKGNFDHDLQKIIKGSYKNKPNGYSDGIRGKGYVLNSLEAALWAFENDENSFEKGVLLAVNLGDDTDTTAAIYGQLAGAHYGIDAIPQRWRNQLFEKDFLLILANGLFARGRIQNSQKRKSTAIEDDDDNVIIPGKARRSERPESRTGPHIFTESK